MAIFFHSHPSPNTPFHSHPSFEEGCGRGEYPQGVQHSKNKSPKLHPHAVTRRIVTKKIEAENPHPKLPLLIASSGFLHTYFSIDCICVHFAKSKDDSWGVRAHALSEWRLELPP